MFARCGRAQSGNPNLSASTTPMKMRKPSHVDTAPPTPMWRPQKNMSAASSILLCHVQPQYSCASQFGLGLGLGLRQNEGSGSVQGPRVGAGARLQIECVRHVRVAVVAAHHAVHVLEVVLVGLRDRSVPRGGVLGRERPESARCEHGIGDLQIVRFQVRMAARHR